MPAAALPGLDAKVDAYLQRAARDRRPSSPEFARAGRRRPHHGRRRHPAGRRDAATGCSRRPVKALQEGGLSEGSKVGSTLLELRRTVEDLDPKGAQGAAQAARHHPVRRQADGLLPQVPERAEPPRRDPARRCYNGQDELRKDNAALNLEKQHLWETMGRLNQYVYVAERLDARLSATIAELEATDPEQAKALREDVLFYVRQKHQDLLTQLAVSIQSYLAIDIVIKNNIELIKGVDRATTTTISALRTAVIVAQALGNQKLVLDQITALNTTTSGLIQRTSRDAPGQLGADPGAGGVGHDRPAAAAGGVRRTSTQTMDAIDTFKVQALDTMAATIGVLETEVAKSQEYLDRVQQA